MRTTLYISDPLLKQAKQYALLHQTTLTAVVEDALRTQLNQTKIKKKKSKITLPTFGKSGLHSGVDIDRTSDLLSIMDNDKL